MKRITEQKVIPALSSMEEIERFIEGPLEVCILLSFPLAMLESTINLIHDNGKSVIIHLDLVRGIANDEAGCEYVIQRLKADGIISTQSCIIETAKRNHCIAIQRLFLSDSKTLEKDIAKINKADPDFIEVLPGLASEIFSFIQVRVHAKLLGGGLIKSDEQIYECLRDGACAVTISSLSLAEKFFRTHM